MAAKKKKKGEPGEVAPPTTPPPALTKVGTGSVIEKFKSPAGVSCPGFWNFKPYNGCGFDCQWCYLKGSRFRREGRDAMDPHQKYERGAIGVLEKALETIPGAEVLNCGEYADGLLFEGFLINKAIPRIHAAFVKAREADVKAGHKLLIVTKSVSEQTITNKDSACNCVIFSHSVNAAAISRQWELKAPHPWSRLKASATAARFGFETRLRIGPLIPVNHWQDGYLELCEKIMEYTPNVTVITLDPIIATKATIGNCITERKERSWFKYCTEDTAFGKRVPATQRIAMYHFIIFTLRSMGYKGKFGLCKETPDVWAKLKEEKVLGHKPGEVKCNCQI